MGLFDHLKKLEEKIGSLLDPAAAPAEAQPAAPAESRAASPAPTPAPEVAVAVVPAVAPAAAPAPPPAPRLREPLELRKAIVRGVEEEITRIDGQPTFPYNRIDVDLVFTDARNKTLLEAELVDKDRLEQDIRKALTATRVPIDPRLAVWTHFISMEKLTEKLNPDSPSTSLLLKQGFVLECTREQETERMRKPEQKRARLEVDHGTAEPMTLVIAKARINVGRMSEVRDQAGRVVRRNDIVFQEDAGGAVGEINSSVSRLHAHVEFDPSAEEYRLYDDNSAEGTVVFRDGRRIQVPQGNRRGVALADGDELHLGQARIIFHRPVK